LSGSDAIDRVIFRGGGELRLSGPASVTNPIIVTTNNSLVINSGTALAAATLFNTVDGTVVVNVPLSRTGDLTINGALVLNAELTVTGNLTIAAAGVVTHALRNRFASVVVSGTFNVQGTINLNALGCGSNTGFDPLTKTCVGAGSQYAGGSYGGRGGGSSAGIYGSEDAPAELGSGGVYGDGGRQGSNGGGFIKIQAGTLVVDGAILANGGDNASTGYSAGGGSGGGIRIDATTFGGTGIIRALGGSGSYGGGGGGRISVSFTTSTFSGQVNAGPGSGAAYGAQGTVRLVSAAGALTIANGRYDLAASHSYASVTLAGNAHLTISGTPTVTAQIALPSGNRISLNSTNALTNVTLSSNIAGTLEINAPFTLGALTLSGALIVNADSTLGSITSTGTLELNATLNLPNLTMNQPARLTHAAGVLDSVLNASGTVLVGALTEIDLDSLGLGGNYTIGPSTLVPTYYGSQYAASTSAGATADWAAATATRSTAARPTWSTSARAAAAATVVAAVAPAAG
jgi:hypothetical protein